MNEISNENRNILVPSSTTESAVLSTQIIPLSGKIEFIRRAKHNMLDFFGISVIAARLKIASERGEDLQNLIDHLNDTCLTFKLKLANLLDYLSYDAGLRDTKKEPVNVSSLLEKVLEDFKNVMDEKDIKIELSISDALPLLIVSNEFQLKQIVSNLLDNALTFAYTGDLIRVEIKKESSNCLLTIDDEGEGMTKEQLNSIFKVHPAERTNLRNPEGLGLLVTRYLAEDILGGKLIIFPKERGGLTCKVYLPFTEGNF